LKVLKLDDPEYVEINVLFGIDVCSTLMRDKFQHEWYGEYVNHPMMLGWVSSGSTRTPGTLQVKNIHRTVESDLSKIRQGFWELEKLPPKRSLSPEEAYCKKMFKMPPRVCSEYSLNSVPMLLVLIMLSLVEPDHRICGEDCRRVRKLQLVKGDFVVTCARSVQQH